MIRVITFNLNGIRAATNKGFFNWVRRQQADFICVQELKAHNPQIITELALEQIFPGYNFYCSYAQKKGYSGVGIFTPHLPQAIQSQLGIAVVDDEGRYLQLDFAPISIVSLYLPSGTSGAVRQNVKMQVLSAYKQYLMQHKLWSKAIVICGDFNIAHQMRDLKNWRANLKNSGFLPAERQWLGELFGDLGFIDAFRVVNQDPGQYTWWTYRSKTAWLHNVGWRIDYQVVTQQLRSKITAARIYKEQRFSDHAPLIIDYALDL